MVEVPEDMSDMFSLPHCRAGGVGLAGCRIGDRCVHFNDNLIPCVKVLRM